MGDHSVFKHMNKVSWSVSSHIGEEQNKEEGEMTKTGREWGKSWLKRWEEG